MFCLKVISTCYFTLIFKFHMTSAFHFIYSTNCKFKVRKLVKALMEVDQWIIKIIMVIQFPRVTLCFPWKVFQHAISLSFSNIICPQSFNLFKVNCKLSVQKVWKLLMEVYQWINMIIMVIQFPRVTLCFPWKVFQHAISLSFSNFICPQLFIYL